jgi:predicted permease
LRPYLVAPQVKGVSQAQTAGVAAAAEGGNLPFTGFSLLGTVIVALGLIALGMVLRRRERSRS